MMDMDRRRFLKLAGLSTAAGLIHPMETIAGEQVIPEELPLRGSRWAMVINIAKCLAEGECTKCIDACHYVHNVPRMENKAHEIKWIWKEQFHYAFEEQVPEYIDEHIKHAPTLVFCNHCDNPPCVRVCPTQATWKREDGIVMMDMHRCIGCRYCVAACPYGSRSFNYRDPRPFIKDLYPDFPTRSKGVVEKCNFCQERLARGIPPACVEACEAGAMTFGDLGDPDSEVRELLNTHYAIRRKPGLGTNPQIYYIV